MTSIIRNIWNLFWEGFLFLSLLFCAQDIYNTMRKEALGKMVQGIPPLMKFNEKLR